MGSTHFYLAIAQYTEFSRTWLQTSSLANILPLLILTNPMTDYSRHFSHSEAFLGPRLPQTRKLDVLI